MTRSELVKLFLSGQINKMEAKQQLKDIDDDMLMAHGGTYRCDICTYTRHVDCPAYCAN
jgi:hypothetical protein